MVVVLMKMSKPSPEMIAAVEGDIDSILVKESTIAGIMPNDDDERAPAVLFMVRTHDDKINAVVMLSASHVAEVAAGLLAASKAVFGTNEHTESQGQAIN